MNFIEDLFTLLRPMHLCNTIKDSNVNGSTDLSLEGPADSHNSGPNETFRCFCLS